MSMSQARVKNVRLERKKRKRKAAKISHLDLRQYTGGTPGAFGKCHHPVSSFPTHADLRRKRDSLIALNTYPEALSDKKIGWILNHPYDASVKKYIAEHFGGGNESSI